MYKIAVLNVNFDRNYDNVLRFNSKTTRNAYFGIPGIFSAAPSCNFAVSSLLETSVVVRYMPPTADLKHLLMCNYAIIQNEENTDDLYFYFINRATQSSGNIVTLDLELDIFQTFYQDIEFSPCLIRRAHLDRFGAIEGTGSTAHISFKAGDTDDNLLYLGEDVPEPPKRITSRTKARPIAFDSATYDQWLADHVKAWVYVYLSPDTAITEGSTVVASTLYTDVQDSAIVSPLSGYKLPSAIVAFPICAEGYDIYIRHTSSSDVLWGGQNVLNWIQTISPYIQSIKLSPRPPFQHYGLGGTFPTESGISVVASGTDDYDKEYITINLTPTNEKVNGIVTYTSIGVAFLRYIPATGYQFDVEIPAPDIFTADGILLNEITSATVHDPDFNPKMYSERYREINVVNATGQSYTYSQQKLNAFNETLTIYYYESLTPDISRSFAAILDPTANGIYTRTAARALLGMISATDMSMPYSTDQLANYLAQNKNFFEQTKYNAGMGLARSLIGVGGGAAQSGISNLRANARNRLNIGAGVAGGAISASQNAASGFMSYAQQIRNMQYTADNMRSAPDQVNNANGSAILNMTISDVSIYVDVYEPLECDKIRINDIMHRFGYSVETIGNIKDYDNIRHYFNYVQAEIEEILGDIPVSQAVRDRFKTAFSNGVRFWNIENTDVEMFDFTPENYENRLVL